MLGAFAEITLLRTIQIEDPVVWSSVFNLTLNNYWHLPELPR